MKVGFEEDEFKFASMLVEKMMTLRNSGKIDSEDLHWLRSRINEHYYSELNTTSLPLRNQSQARNKRVYYLRHFESLENN